MPTHPLRDSLRLHGTPFSSAGSSFFLIWGPEIAWLVKTWQDWFETFETLVDGVLVVADMVDFVVVVVVGVVGLRFPQNQWKKKIRA